MVLERGRMVKLFYCLLFFFLFGLLLFGCCRFFFSCGFFGCCFFSRSFFLVFSRRRRWLERTERDFIPSLMIRSSPTSSSSFFSSDRGRAARLFFRDELSSVVAATCFILAFGRSATKSAAFFSAAHMSRRSL